MQVAYAGGFDRSKFVVVTHWPMEVNMDKKEKAPGKAKPERAAPAVKQPRWPGQNTSAGIKNARAVHDRKPTGRGSARGR